jgi:hypothetical protein
MKYLLLLFLSIGAHAQIIQPPTAPSAPPAPSVASLQQAFSLGVRRPINNEFSHLGGIAQGLFAKMWAPVTTNSPVKVWTDLTYQQRWQAFGTDQCNLRAIYLATVTYLNALIPNAGSALVEPKAVTTAGTGSACLVTVAP